MIEKISGKINGEETSMGKIERNIHNNWYASASHSNLKEFGDSVSTFNDILDSARDREAIYRR